MPIGAEFRPQRPRLHVLRATDRRAEALRRRAEPGSHLVECWTCKDVHWTHERLAQNGTYSECPKCGDDVYTHP